MLSPLSLPPCRLPRDSPGGLSDGTRHQLAQCSGPSATLPDKRVRGVCARAGGVSPFRPRAVEPPRTAHSHPRPRAAEPPPVPPPTINAPRAGRGGSSEQNKEQAPHTCRQVSLPRARFLRGPASRVSQNPVKLAQQTSTSRHRRRTRQQREARRAGPAQALDLGAHFLDFVRVQANHVPCALV